MVTEPNHEHNHPLTQLGCQPQMAAPQELELGLAGGDGADASLLTPEESAAATAAGLNVKAFSAQLPKTSKARATFRLRKTEDSEAIDAAIHNALSRKAKAPQITAARTVAVLLVIVNIVVLSVFGVCYASHAACTHLWNVSLLAWVSMFDITIVSLVLLQLFVRLMLWIVDKIPALLWLNFELHRYRLSMALILWTINLFIIYPLVLDGIQHSDANLPLVRSLLAILGVVIIFTVKIALMQLREAMLIQDLKPGLFTSFLKERTLMRMERSGTQWLKERIGLFSSKYVEFTSPGMRAIATALQKHEASSDPGSVLLQEARKLAVKIFMKYGKPDLTEYLETNGMVAALSADDTRLEPDEWAQPLGGSKSAMVKLFAFFDVDRDGIISITDLVNAIKQIFLERKSLASKIEKRALNFSVSSTLLTFLSVVASVLWVLYEFDYHIMSLLLPLGTLLVAVSFAYATTLQELFESLYMIFVLQPFEIGDVITIDDGQPLIVSKIGLLHTFVHTMEGYGVYYRNATLSKGKLANWNSCKRVMLQVDFCVSEKTSARQLAELETRLRNYFESLPEQWANKFELVATATSSTAISPSNAALSTGLNLSVYAVRKSITWAERKRIRAAKSELVLKLEELTTALGIKEQAAVPVKITEDTHFHLDAFLRTKPE